MLGRVIGEPGLECPLQCLPEWPGHPVEELEAVLGVRGRRVIRTLDLIEEADRLTLGVVPPLGFSSATTAFRVD